MNRLLLKLFLVSLLVLAPGPTAEGQNQTEAILPQKIDSYGAAACDDAMARLDNFAVRLQSEPEAFGYIVVYPERNGLPGKYRSYLDFAKEYLAMTRGISPDRLTALGGEPRNTLTTELWLAAKDPPPTVATAPIEADKNRPRKFDEGFADYSVFEGKQHLRTYDLCPLGAVYLRAFAEQLRAEPNSRGHIVIHLEYGKRSNRAKTMARLLRDEMLKENKIEPNRIVISSGARRRIPAVELWVAPG